MPGKHTYRFLPLGHRQKQHGPPAAMGVQTGDPALEKRALPGRGSGPGVEMSKLPKRSPSRIAHEVLTNSVYKHKQEEAVQRKRRRWLVLGGVAAGALLLLVVVIVVAVVVVTRGAGNPDDGRWGLSSVPPAGPNGVVSIRYNSSDPESYQKMVSDMEDLLEEYETVGVVVRGGLSNCTADNTSIACPPRRARAFKLSNLGKYCTKSQGFGYKSRGPCVLLELRTPPDWDTGTCIGGPSTKTGNVGVTCKAYSTGNGTVASVAHRLYPSDGFTGQVLADRGLQGYMNPLVMLQFTAANYKKEIGLECSVCPGYKEGNDRRIYTTRIVVDIDP